MPETISPYSTASRMLEALRAREVSSVELIEMHNTRIEALNGSLNAIAVRTPELALEAASKADAAIARGEPSALLGLPMTLKESTQTAALPQSAGIPDFKDFRPSANGPIARSVFAAGACLLGKTNIPLALMDWQADSPVYGRTNNPWSLDRTPGGSTGGGAAALAAGMTPLEIGSDIGGSIRVPAAYCGVYGHRPSATAVPREGGYPRAALPNPGTVMSVQGPLARSAFDLELLFDVVTGPVLGEEMWHLTVPPARRERLGDFRVAVMPALPWASASREMQAKVDDLTGFLAKKGTRVAEALPETDIDQYFLDYMRLLMVESSFGQSREQREANARGMAKDDPVQNAQAEGLTLDAAGHIMLLNRREAVREAWRHFFQDWDVLIAPMTLDAAFRHQEGDMRARTLVVDGDEVPYLRNIVYPMWAIYAGLPSTALPAGLNSAGLPLGLQAIGPNLEDRTTLRFAQLLEREWQGFQPPPGY